jgi:hypothetical protein
MRGRKTNNGVSYHVKAEREKLHALVNEYAGLTK